MHQHQAITNSQPIPTSAKKQLVHHTNIGLEKIKVHIRKLAPYNQKSLAHEQTKDCSVIAWVAHMKPF
jgi:hypothetical protein